ncbi:YHS domain protein [Gimesia panareensis]|uniref:YHS domain protein n=1 Tax=Gimesia panareensis TaxID=2527978 RepID=A0A518FH60_9PLAN|nr:YHS domain-containing protein [Gimesia panareensis]QDV15675.1 YHS domain protein [Gimesia panareensis]
MRNLCKSVVCLLCVSALLWFAGSVQGEPEKAASASSAKKSVSIPAEVKQALSEFNSLIGGWRGVGMIKRNSRKGAWSEKAEWVWKFDPQQSGIAYEVEDGKFLKSALLSYDPKQKTYQLSTVLPDGTTRDYSGTLQKDSLVLESKPDQEGAIFRISIRRLNEKRTLVLFEQRNQGQSFYYRLAEVGYTRAGTRLAAPGSGGPECIVTGGAGTIAVSYQGKTYYVCCSGCKQAFEDDPETFIAEAKQKAAERRKQQSR